MAHLVRFVLSCVFVTGSCVVVDAASLYGKVIEVNSGDVITIFNLNRPVRVKLLGVDAPEMSQEFGDVAKKHLSDLVFNQAVLVNYSGIGPDKSLTGKVLLNDADIGAQMIRDGAAWLDANNSDRLSESDREVYQQSELAARSERRGLWQAENPVAPWEFIRVQALRKNQIVPSKTNNSPTIVKRNGSPSELTNLTLMMTPAINAAAGGPANVSLLKRELIEGTELPAGLPFKVLIPRGGTRVVESIAFGLGIVKSNQYAVAEGKTQFIVMWFTAPTYGEDDKMALDQLVFETAKKGAGGAFSGGNPQARCAPQSEREIESNGYSGEELDLTACLIPARIRAFTKASGDQREVYVALVNFIEDDASAMRFLKSFAIRDKKPLGSKTQK